MESAKLTYAEFMQLPYDGYYYELIDGEVVRYASCYTKHQLVRGHLGTRLWQYLRDSLERCVFFAPIGILIADDLVLMPDIVVVKNELLTEYDIHGVPDIVVEILSEESRHADETTRFSAYERHGVPEYWIIDPAAESVKFYRRDANDKFQCAIELTCATGGMITSPLLPGFQEPIADIFDRVFKPAP
ncbi:MAG TPA: Uma2 family endonuclease [Thermoanaerobaculia bacterium]|nr:Uma2 family endonuclease [Thermoanaerobaculia bacterium]